MSAHTKKSVPSFTSSPMFLVILAFLIGFCTHILVTVIFADTKNDGTIHACVSKNGDVRIVTDSTERKQGKNGCRENETPLSWNQQANAQVSPSTNAFPFYCEQCDMTKDDVGDRLKGKDYTGAMFLSDNLSNADLTGDNFSNALLKATNLSGTNLSSANFTNADLTGSTGLSSATVNGTIWSNTTCPDGSNSDKNNNTCIGH